VAATGPAGAAGPATTGGAVGASGAGTCATGGGESNACAWTGALTPEEAAVGGTSGSAGDIGAGGTAPAAAESGAPVCSPLSKLCINSPGVRPWTEPGGASGPPGTDGIGGPDIDGVWVAGKPATFGANGAAGAGVGAGAGVAATGADLGGYAAAAVMFIREPGTPGACRGATAGAMYSPPPPIFIAEPGAPAACAGGDGSVEPSTLSVKPILEPGLSSIRRTCPSK